MNKTIDDQAQKSIERCLKELEFKYGKRVVSISLRDDFIASSPHIDSIRNFFSNISSYPILIVNGTGGVIESFLAMGIIMKEFTNSFEIFVPADCSSAMFYLICMADKVFISNDTKITQCDPLIQAEDGTMIRLIKNLANPRYRKIVTKYSDWLKESILENRYLFPKLPKSTKQFEPWFWDFLKKIMQQGDEEGHSKRVSIEFLKKKGMNLKNETDIEKIELANRLLKLQRENYLERQDTENTPDYVIHYSEFPTAVALGIVARK